MISRTMRRIRALRRLRQKNDPELFIERWERATLRLWLIFNRMPVSEDSLEFLERNMNRFCSLHPNTSKSTLEQVEYFIKLIIQERHMGKTTIDVGRQSINGKK